MLEADTGYFTPQNGGFLVNTAFIATDEGVVVIGSGPSRQFGERYRKLIEDTTGKRVLEVIITHKHPDHFLGNQAFRDVPIRADAKTTAMIKAEGEGLAENLYRLVGDGMRGTEALAPTAPLNLGVRNIGGHRLEFIAVPGHTQSDIAVFDHTTGVLFAIDQVFNQRTPTLPNADLAQWRQSLAQLAAVPFKLLVPGHGPVSRDAAPIAATRDYLDWLDATLRDAAEVVRHAPFYGTIDALQVDLYDHEAAAPVLDSPDFYADCRHLLTDEGALTVNLFGRDASYERSLESICAAFGADAVWTFKPTREGNAIVLALRTPQHPERMELLARAERIQERWGLPAVKWLKVFTAMAAAR